MIKKLPIKTLISASLISLSCFLSACTTNPYTGETEASRAGVGVGFGAASGAILGSMVGNGQGALIGAGMGAIAGGVIGASMDEQAAQLGRELRSTGVQVTRHGHDIRLIMPSDITFSTNHSSIKPRFYRVLNSVAIVLRKYDRTVIRVIGYTDNVGTAEYNQVLSEKRAAAVADYLSGQGIRARRFSVVGYGKRYPIASNKTKRGRAENRRVEIIIHRI